MGAGRPKPCVRCSGPTLVDSKEILLYGKSYNFKRPSEAIEAGFVYMTEDRKLDGTALGLDIESNITFSFPKNSLVMACAG